jgi:HSP20 family protein
MAKKDVEVRKETGQVPVERQVFTNPVYEFRQAMDRLMENFFEGFDTRHFGRRSDSFVPQVDVVDTDKEIKISAELPGLDEKDLEVSLTRDAVTIRGEKREEKEEKGKDYYRSERSYGSFTRTVPLPVDIDAEKVVASFKKGVLTVKLPKTKQAISETKKVSIKAE